MVQSPALSSSCVNVRAAREPAPRKQGMAQSYQAFRESLNLPSGDVDPKSLPLPKLPIPPFEVPASVAAEAMRAAAEEMEEMTLQQGASRDATASPKTCRLRLDNFLDPDDISDDDDHEWADVEADPTGDLLPGMVPAAISEAPAPGAMRSVALHRPAAVRATALPEDEDPEGLLAAIGAEWDDEDEDEGEGEGPPAERASEPTTTGQAADEPPAELGTGVSLEGVEAFSLDPSFDYDNVKCSERFSVDTARREGEFYDRE